MATALRSRVFIGLAVAGLLFLAWRFVLLDILLGWNKSTFFALDGSFNSGKPHYRRVELENHRIEMPFLDSVSFRSPNWNIAGDVVVDNQRFVALTSDKKHQAGLICNKNPLNAESFEIDLTFHINGHTKLSADGMAVWLTEKPSRIGDVFGGRGDYVGLGIFIDTFKNGPSGQFPFVSAQVGHGSDFYNKFEDGLHTQSAGCVSNSLLNPASGKTKMRIIYTKSGFLSVDFNYDPDNSDDWHNCFTISSVALPKTKYLGMSAESGELTENVEVLSNYVYGLYQPDSETFIETLDQVDFLDEDNEESETNAPSMVSKHDRRRKSSQRLKLSEERVRQRDRARRLRDYGDPDATFVRRWWKRIVNFTKGFMALALLVLSGWIVRLVMKTRQQNRPSRTTGLLD